MKKELISPVFSGSAMLLLLGSQLFGDKPLNWLGYLALVLVVVNIFVIFSILKKHKKD